MKKILLIFLLLCVTNTNAATLDSELLINGGAETGDTTGWVSTGISAVVPDIYSQGFGSYVFTGGTGAVTQTLVQQIDLSGNSSEIDNGSIMSIFSIYLQSRSAGNTTDIAKVDVTFRDGSHSAIGSYSFVDDINLELFDWNFYSDYRSVPVGTRSVEIFLTASRVGGLYSDAFFDEASFKLTAVPIPAGIWLFSSSILSLFYFGRTFRHSRGYSGSV
jgi:hypothetical protein